MTTTYLNALPSSQKSKAATLDSQTNVVDPEKAIYDFIAIIARQIAMDFHQAEGGCGMIGIHFVVSLLVFLGLALITF